MLMTKTIENPATISSIAMEQSAVQGVVVSESTTVKECCYKSYRRRSSAFKGQGYILDPSHLENLTGDETENENESDSESKTVSAIGLFLLFICFAYAVFFSMIFTYLFGWKTNPFSKFARKSTISEAAFPKSRSSSTLRKSLSQG